MASRRATTRGGLAPNNGPPETDRARTRPGREARTTTPTRADARRNARRRRRPTPSRPDEGRARLGCAAGGAPSARDDDSVATLRGRSGPASAAFSSKALAPGARANDEIARPDLSERYSLPSLLISAIKAHARAIPPLPRRRAASRTLGALDRLARAASPALARGVSGGATSKNSNYKIKYHTP